MKKLLAIVLCIVLVTTAFAGCGAGKANQEESKISLAPDSTTESSLEESSEDSQPENTTSSGDITVKVAGMMGPTGIAMVHLIENNEKGKTLNNYEVTLEGAADAVAGKIINGELDIAAVPVNLASVIYNRTNNEVTFLGVNTLGVLYLLTNEANVTSVADLKGKTIYSTGKGTTPEYTLRHILLENGIHPDNDVTIIYESEATALQTKLVAGEVSIAILPEPMVTAVTTKNPEIQISLNMTEEWEKVTGGKALTTGGVIVRNDFLAENPNAVAAFMNDYALSCTLAVENLEETAQLLAKYGIIENNEIAMKAIPRCNIKFLQGEEMTEAVGEYLSVLYGANPESVGGSLPDEKFYYQG